jgi:regulator of protease activity HflC (stomatin/prohibitin superfamily)
MDRRGLRLNGFLMLLLTLIEGYAVFKLLELFKDDGAATTLTLLIGGLIFVGGLTGLVVVNPNQARVVQFFGRYVGTVTKAGFGWTVPYSTKRRISMRVRNFESSKLKVSDADGNPVEIAAVVVWRVVDPAKAAFAVDDHIGYVAVQSETAVRHLATTYPYDAHDSDRVSLRDSSAVNEALTTELRERVERAGVEVLESRITHLAYAPEIAQAMLARQQASAIVSARFKIVEGAVGMVQQALEQLHAQGVVDLDEERKAQMVANLLVVLCGDRAAQPVLNTGTLYS